MLNFPTFNLNIKEESLDREHIYEQEQSASDRVHSSELSDN
jgi:hypothetical protein